MKKKLLAAALALCMLLSISTVALAADDGTAADAPVGGTGTKVSSGAAAVEGADFDITGDDDITASDATDTSGADISLWAKVNAATSSGIVYKLDITWGNFVFWFHRADNKWNPETHAYDGPPDPNSAYWTFNEDGSRTNNSTMDNVIMVTNHSNYAMSVTYGFEMVEGVFNSDPDNPDKVVARFYARDGFPNGGARRNGGTGNLAALRRVTNTAGMLEDGSDIDNYALRDDELTWYLDTAAEYTLYRTTTIAGARTNSRFLTLSGTPDDNKILAMTSATKIGTITVTIAKNDERQGQYDSAG